MRLTIQTRHRKLTICTGDDADETTEDAADGQMVAGPSAADLSVAGVLVEQLGLPDDMPLERKPAKPRRTGFTA